MNQEVKKEWCETLRSGKFKQGKGKLRSGNDAYCCLGVLSEIYREKTGKGYWVEVKENELSSAPNSCFRFVSEHANNTVFLTKDVQDWAGVESSDVKVRMTSLASLNDNGESFEGIADIIEKEF